MIDCLHGDSLSDDMGFDKSLTVLSEIISGPDCKSFDPVVCLMIESRLR